MLSRIDKGVSRIGAMPQGGAARSLPLRLLLKSPKDLVAGMFASAAVLAIIGNAMFMQAGRHPSPMFGAPFASVPSSVAIVAMPRPRPAEADIRAPDSRMLDSRLLTPKAVETRASEPRPAENKPVEAHVAPVRPVAVAAPRPPAPVPGAARADPLGELIVSSRRTAAVQRALTEFGYGQLKPTGTIGSETQAAIQKFERDRKMPVTGQMSDRLVRELAAVTGRPVE